MTARSRSPRAPISRWVLHALRTLLRPSEISNLGSEISSLTRPTDGPDCVTDDARTTRRSSRSARMPVRPVLGPRQHATPLASPGPLQTAGIFRIALAFLSSCLRAFVPACLRASVPSSRTPIHAALVSPRPVGGRPDATSACPLIALGPDSVARLGISAAQVSRTKSELPCAAPLERSDDECGIGTPLPACDRDWRVSEDRQCAAAVPVYDFPVLLGPGGGYVTYWPDQAHHHGG